MFRIVTAGNFQPVLIQGCVEQQLYKKILSMKNNGAMGGVYGLAFIGALVYYIQHATSFGMGVVGVFKAMVWPAMVVYHLMRHLGM